MHSYMFSPFTNSSASTAVQRRGWRVSDDEGPGYKPVLHDGAWRGLFHSVGKHSTGVVPVEPNTGNQPIDYFLVIIVCAILTVELIWINR